jgi:thiol-disulfide isomerase/thioredoxin
MRKQKWLQWLILIVIIGVGGVAVFSSFFKPKDNPVKPGYAAPSFKLATVNGDVHTLAEFKGKPLVINFWGSFCEACVREMPLLQKSYLAYKGKGIQFVGINLDESQIAVQSFLRQTEVGYPVFLDPGAKVRDKYEVVSYPTTFFLDKAGKIVDSYVGEMTEPIIQAELDQLLQ